MALDRLEKIIGVKANETEPVVDIIDDSFYRESEPTTAGFFRERVPTAGGAVAYLKSLFPFLSWIFHYNVTWLIGDLVAGITVGFVVVPQGMAYALLAKLPAEYGLYTSFVGFLLYWAFATSKDITIGTVAVMSTIVGNIVTRVQETHPGQFEPDEIARGLSVISGCVLLFLGLFRLGFIVEFIPLIGITSFMTGAAISIGVGQVPAMMGIPDIKTREPTYLVIINTLKGLPRSRIDAAMGLSALAALYFIRWFCSFMAKRQPSRRKTWFFISTLRMAFVILLYILISWLVNRGVTDPKKARFKILGNVPSGFQHAGVPRLDTDLLGALGPDIPTTILVLIIEHIAISKSFGRINNYIIDPSQELVAIGFTNVFGPFLGGYPATGSFSRTAIKSKAGVRTPLAGIFTAVIVLLALYALTSVFFFIPMASLSALIIHAVGDLVTPPKVVYRFWLMSPLEVVIFFAGVFCTIFSSIENGIYLAIAASAALLLYRLARAPGKFLGKANLYSARATILRSGPTVEKQALEDPAPREGFVPYDRTDLSNPNVLLTSPHPGVFVYRFSEGFNYLNSAHHLDELTTRVFNETRRTELDRLEKVGDRPWNDPGPRRGRPHATEEIASRPFLHAIVLDFSAIDYVDVTSVQALIDLRDQFNRYAAPNHVDWHFAGVANRWTKRALVAAGFGYPRRLDVDESSGEKSSHFVTLADAESGLATLSTHVSNKARSDNTPSLDEVQQESTTPSLGHGDVVPVYGVNRPFFHIDLTAAVDSAVARARGHGSP